MLQRNLFVVESVIWRNRRPNPILEGPIVGTVRLTDACHRHNCPRLVPLHLKLDANDPPFHSPLHCDLQVETFSAKSYANESCRKRPHSTAFSNRKILLPTVTHWMLLR